MVEISTNTHFKVMCVGSQLKGCALIRNRLIRCSLSANLDLQRFSPLDLLGEVAIIAEDHARVVNIHIFFMWWPGNPNVKEQIAMTI